MPGHAPRGLRARLFAKLDRSAGPGACWPFKGAHSRGSGRGVAYPHLQEGGRGSRHWRVCRLVLLLRDLPGDLLDAPEADFLAALAEADRARVGLEAAHTCDNSRCGNADHLEWQAHGEQVREQAARRRQAREVAA